MKSIIIDCYRCGGSFAISSVMYQKRKQSRSRILCPGCLIESKIKRYRKVGNKIASIWASYTDAERSKRIRNATDGIHNMSEEDKIKRSRNSSIAATRQMENMTPEEKMSLRKRVSEWNINRYASMSESEKAIIGKKISDGLNNRSDEEKRKSNKQRSETLKATIAAMTPEERAARNQRAQEYWDSMTPEEYQKWKLKQANGYSEYTSKLSVEPNQNELCFINFMNIYKVKFEFQSFNTTVHPDFNKLFPINPVTGSKFVNPFHKWDFRLFTRDGEILVDIDGSIHFNKSYSMIHQFTKIEYELLDYYKFKDSQRIYQTDGLMAYAIICKDDNLTYDTSVKILNTDEMISFKAFLSIIEWMNLDEKSKRQIAKSPT